ncbi:MAG: SDR family NAD(P)-dependent oxidoreductase, partial [Armatimonadetes bacterium]|nr:SDR family NAD(P)-dependent oxidoreductase [Armatimonadota bacterium]
MTGFESPILAGKTALVTGGGRGIGAATALTLAQAGADVAVAARTEAEVQDVAGQVLALGRRSVAICCDLAREEECLRAVEQASRELGGVAILVNNAG